MRIDFTAPSLDNEDWYPAYDVLVKLVEKGRHGIDPVAIPSIFASRWIANRPQSLRDLIRTLIQSRSRISGVDRTRVLIDLNSPPGGQVDMATHTAVLSPLDAIAYLSAPFHIIVENEVYDGAFILWMAKAVGFDKLIHAYKEGRFIFRHAGGKSGFVRSAEVMTMGVLPGATLQHGGAMRLWSAGFLDSDSKHPGESPNDSIIKAAKHHVTFIRQLKRRSIENYIPRFYLEKRFVSKEHRKAISALFRMTDEQRRHFHLKVGFRHSKKGSRTKNSFMSSANVTLAEKELFKTVSDNDFVALSLGFGDGLSELFRDPRSRSSGNDPHMVDSGDRAEMLSLCQALLERF